MLLTLFSYYRAIRLMFQPSKLLEPSIVLLRRKMERQIRATIMHRLANNALIKYLDQWGVGNPVTKPSPANSEQYLTIRLRRTGIIEDIHIGRLRTMIRQLPYVDAYRAHKIDDDFDSFERSEQLPRSECVWIAKWYGSLVTKENTDFLIIERSSLRDEINESTITRKLSQAIKLATPQ